MLKLENRIFGVHAEKAARNRFAMVRIKALSLRQ